MKIDSEQILKRLEDIVFHPFIFAALPIIVTLYEVKNIVLPEEAIPSLIIVECATAIVFLVTSGLFRNFRKAGILCTVSIAMLFLYRVLSLTIVNFLGLFTASPDVRLILFIYFFLFLAFISSILKEKWVWGKNTFELDNKVFTKNLNIASVIMLIFNVIPLTIFEIQNESLNKEFAQQFNSFANGIHLDESAPKPDVYYVIVDGMANPYTMKNMFHCDDSKLFNFLKDNRFYIVDKACSNYDRTEFSVSSSLNMQYIEAVPDKLGHDYDGLNVFCRMIQDSAVRKVFKRLGYSFINLSSGTSATDWIYAADKNIRCSPFNHFMTALLLLTPLYATEKFYPATRDLLIDMRICPGHCLKDVASLPGPKFVLMHTDIAHAPCLFDQNGNRLPLADGQYMINWGTPAQLAGQWQYASTLLVDWLNRLLQYTDRKAVIIVQSDHGSGINFAKHEDWCNERMRIWNAYYLPSKGDQGLYPTITPVNSFRVVFNDYFKAGLPMLPDKVLCPPIYTKPYDVVDVRQSIHFP